MSEWHSHNVFFHDGDKVFRTHFINNSGDEAMGSTWSYLDITPLGPQVTDPQEAARKRDAEVKA